MAVARFVSRPVASLLAGPVAGYIGMQRDRLNRRAIALSPSVRDQFRPYFSSLDLERVRIVEADSLPIPDPPFSSHARWLGLRFPSLAQTAGITFDHVVAVRTPVRASLLFHELVHVAQYRLLGVRRFAYLYVRGFLSGGGYEHIPLERSAYELEQRFESERRAFRVDAALWQWIEHDRF